MFFSTLLISKRNPERKSATVARLDGDDLVQFDGKQIVSGIVYHLTEEGLARSVDDASVQCTVRRLAERGDSPCMPRSLWREMSNPARLQWLLNQGQTRVTIGYDGKATLGTMAKKLW